MSNFNIYTVKTSSFEGPFGLLLSLVEEKKLFINEVSLAEVTEDYLNYVNSLEGVSKEEIASFIVVASTLILIKSKSLLPTLELTQEEETDIKNLEDRLKLYELYTRLGLYIKQNFGRQIIFAPNPRKVELVFLPDHRITPEHMMEFAHLALGKIPKQTSLFPSVEVKKVISIEEMIDSLTERIQKGLRLSWSQMHGQPKNKEEKVLAIVSFLAMLELIRTGLLDALQDANFDEIVIEKREEDLEIEINNEPGK